MEKKAIIQIVSRLNIGGPSRVILYNHQRLLNSEYQPYIITGHPPVFEPEIEIPIECRQNLIYVKGLGPNSGLLNSIAAFFIIRKLLKKIKPIAIHSHQSKAGFFSRLCGYLTGVPNIIHTYHGHVFSGYFNPIKTYIIKFIEKNLSKFTTFNITISKQVHQEIVNIYKISPLNKTIQIEVGIHPDFFNLKPNKNECIKKYNLPLDLKIIGFVGRLEPIKAPLEFLNLAKKYCEKYSDCHFVIAGGGGLKEQIELYISKNNLKNNVSILSWVENVEEILICLDLLVLTSKNEGTPLIIMEAMAMNIPVLATKVGGIPDLIDQNHTGFFFSETPENSEIDLKNVLELKIDQMDKIRKNAFENIKSNFTLDKQYQKMISVYKSKIEK